MKYIRGYIIDNYIIVVNLVNKHVQLLAYQI